MRLEKIESIVANKAYSDEDAAGMTGITVEEVKKMRTPVAPKVAPKKAATSKKKK
tara:strand:- start:211 stop:375 length:165 start_codon:yes stop_codon:yes gene_type:complete